MPDRRDRETRLLRICTASFLGILVGCAILGWAAGIAVSRHPQPLEVGVLAALGLAYWTIGAALLIGWLMETNA
jgi:hypothetical protein